MSSTSPEPRDTAELALLIRELETAQSRERREEVVAEIVLLSGAGAVSFLEKHVQDSTGLLLSLLEGGRLTARADHYVRQAALCRQILSVTSHIDDPGQLILIVAAATGLLGLANRGECDEAQRQVAIDRVQQVLHVSKPDPAIDVIRIAARNALLVYSPTEAGDDAPPEPTGTSSHMPTLFAQLSRVLAQGDYNDRITDILAISNAALERTRDDPMSLVLLMIAGRELTHGGRKYDGLRLLGIAAHQARLATERSANPPRFLLQLHYDTATALASALIVDSDAREKNSRKILRLLGPVIQQGHVPWR